MPKPRETRDSVAILVALGFIVLLAQTSGSATPQGDLSYSRGYLITGNYVVASVDFTPQTNPADLNGLATGTIQVSNVPTNDVIAAYLYWEAIHPFDPTPDASAVDHANPALGVKFRGVPISPGTVRASTRPLVGNGAPCWGAAGGKSGYAVTMLRANVLHLLPKQLDANDKWTGKYLINGPHTVTLPESSGDLATQSAGATLFVVYRNLAEPLRKIVVYDGIHTAYDGVNTSPESTPMSQTIAGFYKSSTASARITHLVGTGGNNGTEQVSLKNTVISSGDAFPQTSPSSDRSWKDATYDVNVMPGTNLGAYGEAVTTTVTANSSPAACRAWAAVFFSTVVLDVDNDGLPDGLEDAPGGLLDPNDVQLPDLNAMGANSTHKDLFVEFNAMWAAPGTSYGSANAPYSATQPTVTDPVGHHHRPTPETLKQIGDRYAAHGITAHFDVGNVAAYHSLPTVQHTDWVDNYSSTEADQYLVGSGIPQTNVATLARGGEVIKEVACDPSSATCVFPDYPGTVGWELGMRLHRDAPVGNNGEEISLNASDPNFFDWQASEQHRTRLDRARRPFFHYLLNAHARGTPKSSSPCLVNGLPAPYDANNGTACTTNNPSFHVPTSSGGVANLPGRNALVTLGFWDEFVGRPFVRAATTFHELGHNLNLWHGGLENVWGNQAQDTTTYVEPNCKPNYFTSMSYLFQVHGLFDQNDNIHFDYSGTALDALNEAASLSDGRLMTTPSYRPAWYAPFPSVLATQLGVSSAASRYCSGAQFGPSQPDGAMARVYSNDFDAVSGWRFDWDGDGVIEALSGSQDVNFDGTLTGAPELLNGANDWANVRLEQISAGGLSGGGDELIFFGGGDDLIFFGGADELIFFGGADDLIFFGGADDLVSFGGADELIFFGGGDELLSFGGGDDLISFGGGDDLIFFGGADDLISFGGSDRPELTYTGAGELGRPAPYSLKACVIGTNQNCNVVPAAGPGTALYHRVLLRWNASTVGHVSPYHVQRKRADQPDSAYAPIGTSLTNAFVDTEELPQGVQFAYRVRGEFDDSTPHQFSGWSMPATIAAVAPAAAAFAINDAPTAVADSYTVSSNGVLQVPPATGVLSNDTDPDSPLAFIGRRALLVTNVAHGTLVLNANGSFTYTPDKNYLGPDSFTYAADDGLWSGDSTVPLSSFSSVVTVSIDVKKKNQ